MANNFGNDLILDQYGDLIIGDNGDFATTEDLEKKIPEEDLPFPGYISIRESLYNVLLSEKGDWQFDISTGANVPYYISQPMNKKFDDLKNSIRNEILKDDRIESVPDVSITKFPEQSLAEISITIKPVGQEKTSNFVFPYILH